MLKVRRENLLFLGLTVSTCSLLFNFWEPLNYLKYFILIPSILALTFGTKRTHIKIGASQPPTKLFFLFSLHAILSFVALQNRFTAIDFLIYLNIALFSLASATTTFNIRRTFQVFSLLFSLWLIQQVNLYGLSETFGNMGPALDSTSGSKLKFSIPCYIFGLFFIYFLWAKDRSYLLYAAIGVAVTSKRAAMLALLLIFIVYITPAKSRSLVLNRGTLITVNILWLFGSTIIASEFFSELISSIFGVSASAFTMGRNVIYGAALELSSTSFLSLLIGIGEGSTYTHLAGHESLLVFEGLDKVLLHNEILRIFIEGGIPLFIISLFLMYPKRQNHFVWSCMLFLNIVSFFDNLMVYSLVWYYFIVITKSRPTSNRVRFFLDASTSHLTQRDQSRLHRR